MIAVMHLATGILKSQLKVFIKKKIKKINKTYFCCNVQCIVNEWTS